MSLVTITTLIGVVAGAGLAGGRKQGPAGVGVSTLIGGMLGWLVGVVFG